MNALPERYVVERRGSPDPPNAQYFVLDIANDFCARYALWFLVRAYRSAARNVVADELEKALRDTDAAHRQTYEHPVLPKKRGRPRKGEYRP